MIPKGAETVEMVDGRVYYSTDNWATVWVTTIVEITPPGVARARRVTGRAADLARFLAVAQSSAG